MQLKRCTAWGLALAAAAIDNSIEHGWTKLVPPNTNGQHEGNGDTRKPRILTDEELATWRPC